jgi:hypothetical protein
VVVDAVKEPIRPLAGVNVVVCLNEEKSGKKFQEKPKKGLDRADIVRDVRLPGWCQWVEATLSSNPIRIENKAKNPWLGLGQPDPALARS